MELRELFKKANYNDNALIELIEYYDTFIELYAKKRNFLNWEDCYSYVKIYFIQDIKSRKLDRYLSKSNSELDKLIKGILQNKSFDYWRSKSNIFNESSTLNLCISKSSDRSINNIINKITLNDLMDKHLTKTEHEVIIELILKDKKASVVSKELNKSVTTINKTKHKALKKLWKFIQEGGQICGN